MESYHEKMNFKGTLSRKSPSDLMSMEEGAVKMPTVFETVV